MYGEKLSEGLALVSVTDPASVGVGTVDSDVIDMRVFRRVIWVLAAGVLGAGSTIQLILYANTANSASGGTAITGKTLTATTFSGTADNNTQAIIEVTAEEVAAALPDARYLYGEITVGTAASLLCCVALGDAARYCPASDYDLASVSEIVS